MPPFAAQGLNSGVRDVENLCWKLASVLRGRASDRLLDTYETERKPHARAMVDLSVRLGRVVMTSKPMVANARDFLVRVATKLPPSRRYLSEMRFRPAAIYREGFVVAAGDKGLVGRMIPQPRVLDANGRMVLLDDILGSGFALIGVACDEDAWVEAKDLDGLGCRLVDVALDDMGARNVDGRIGMCDADGRMHELLSPYRGRMLLVRPDRFVAAAAPAKKMRDVAARLAEFAS
jgi:3-(3-hydroxy-phenyl)propionate hydroxylase